MKSVMISIKPKWCELIVTEQKKEWSELLVLLTNPTGAEK